MSASDAPDLPPAWAYAFDWEDPAHCSVGAELAVEDLADDVLPEPLRSEIAALDDEIAYRRLDELADAAEADEQYDRAEELRAAARRLDYCHGGCCCAMDAWQLEKEFVDSELLDPLGDLTWSVTEDGSRWRGETRTTHNDRGDVDLDGLFELVSRRHGWSQLELSWDGAKLTVVFDGPDIRRAELTCTPLLDSAQLRAYELWGGDDPYNEEIATGVVDADPTRLAHAVRLWTSVADPEDICSFAALLEALETVDGATLGTEVLEIARSIAEGWESSTAELLTISTDVLAPTVRGFAAAA